jgi:hypothetical protein
MKNRKRESCTSGTVRDEDGNILIYSARPMTDGAANAAARAGVRKPPKEEIAGRDMGGGAAGSMAIWLLRVGHPMGADGVEQHGRCERYARARCFGDTRVQQSMKVD